MRLTRKFLLVFAVAIVVVLALDAARLSRELALFDGDMRRSAASTGQVLGRAVQDEWRHRGAEEALALVRKADLDAAYVRVHWVWLDDPTIAGRLVPTDMSALLGGATVSAREERSNASPGYLYTYSPVPTPTPNRGAIELRTSLDDESGYLHVTRRELVIEAVSIFAASTLIASFLGSVFIGKPVGQLVSKARRVGTGDFSGPIVLNQKDELGELSSEINAMCDRLANSEALVQEETMARDTALEQLRHADRLATVGKLASGIAHELGTPLNVIAGRAQMMAQDGDSNEASESARIIGDQTKRIAKIIRQLLDFSRRGQAARAPADLRIIASQCVSMVSTMAAEARVTLSLHPGAGKVVSFADDGQMQQVMTNLVVNAIQATPRDGSVDVELGEEIAEPPADHGGVRQRYVFMRVTDTGTGMDPKTRARVFEPFFTTKEVGAGTGLGLSVAYGIVREHGGWIDVESELGAGSRFTIRLPPFEEGAMT